MSKHHLGEFEEIVLLTVAILHNEAYGIAIIDEMEERLGRKVSIGALQTVLRRLEKKGYLSSDLGEATKVRGGKRKRYFTITAFGKKVLAEVKEQRMSLWNAVPEVVWGNNYGV
ncbi:MAG: helix-turn-helix transcriptional regulator [Bacteroidota bacterium]